MPRLGSGLALRHPGLRLPRHRATTAQLGVIYPAQVDGTNRGHGVCLGIDHGAGRAPFCFDAFEAYGDGELTSPNVLVLGEIGSGKSTCVKTMILRSAGLLRSPSGGRRFVAILDPKGEYVGLGAALGLPQLRLYPGGGDRLNPLAASSDGDPVQDTNRRTAVVIALAGATLGRDLTAVEEAGIGWAVTAVSQTTTKQTPTLRDVVGVLAQPTEQMARAAGRSADELAVNVSDARYALSKLCDRHLRGMLDGPSTVPLTRAGGGVVVDLSCLYHDHDALNVVMISVVAWLQALLATADAQRERLQAYQVWDECWALTGRVQSARYMQASQKLARLYGITNVAVTHRISDLRAQTDDGTTAAKISAGLLADAQVRVLFRQPPDQVHEATRALGLTAPEAEQLGNLPRGRALWKLPDRSTLVDHVIGPDEWALCDTDMRLVS